MSILYGLIGAGGYGREVMPLANSALKFELNREDKKLLFVVENINNETTTNGHPIISLEDFLQLSNPKKFNIAIGDSQVRQRISEVLLGFGVEPFSIKSNNVIVMDNNDIGPGSILSPFVTITSNVKIGSFFHANLYSYIAHDCVIGNFVTFAPSVKCNGNVIIEDHAYIGTGAIIKQGTKGNPLVIGKGSIVGMGAVVTKSVPPNTTVIGNPARPIQK
jgi:sugar O-acyltransferase (sialic acid O-acetyltransferase NeuD family)